jgi:ferredoxin
MKAIVDRDACIGCGLCPDVCPEVFEMDNEEKAVTKVNPVPPELQDKCKEAAESCPSDAIKIEE